MNTLTAREALDAAVREHLRRAWERGMETAPHGTGALADKGAPASFKALAWFIDAYAAAIAAHWQARQAEGGEGE